jgi:hypothetical protein
MFIMAVWFGGAVFLSFVSGPAFFAEPMLAVFRKTGASDAKQFSGMAAMVVLQRYFVFHYVCGGLALLHWSVCRTFLKSSSGWRGGSLGLLLAIALWGGLYVQPILKQLHTEKYDASAAVEARENAGRRFVVWHGVSQSANLLIVAGLGCLLAAYAAEGWSPRLLSKPKSTE